MWGTCGIILYVKGIIKKKKGNEFMIIAKEFEKLVEPSHFDGKVFDKARESGRGMTERSLDFLREKASGLNKSIVIDRVDNSKERNFDITDDFRFVYRTTKGEEKERDITSYAFQQLCTRMGIPSQYLIKCHESGKTNLVLENFKAWSNEYKGTLQIMANDLTNATRAVMTDSYERYDYDKVLMNIKTVLNLDRWTLVQNYFSEDFLVLRFVDTTSPYYTDSNSQNYVMLTITTSDVGRGGLKVRLSSYRRVCSNGMIINNGRDGVLYNQPHAGKEMRDSKIVAFNKAFLKAENYGGLFAKGIENCREEKLNPREFDMWIEKAKRDMRLSKENVENLTEIINADYDHSVWGVTNGVTQLAQNFNLDDRLNAETWAGNVFGTRL